MAQSLVMASPDGDTLVVSMYAPVSVKYKGASLTITTDYPFDDTGKYSIERRTKITRPYFIQLLLLAFVPLQRLSNSVSHPGPMGPL